MCTLIKPLFRLTVIAFICAMLLPVTTTRADPDCARHPGNPNCPPPDDPPPSVTYTVGLTGRVFHFDFAVNVTPNAKENALFPDAGVTLTFSRPSDADARDAWDAVFAACENFFGPNPITGPTTIVVSGFTVPAGDWRINRDGGVRLVMIDIPFDSTATYNPVDPHFKVTLLLIGDTFFDGPDAPWLPDTGNATDYKIIDSLIHGGTVKGVRPRKSCVSKGGTDVTENFDPGAETTLVITATE